MSLERWIRLIAGSFVTTSVVLGYLHSPYWLLFTLFVGLNLFQSAMTRWCLMEKVLERLGVRSEAAAARA
jgi:Inner membrane protein YgaP-like, transmembrane domain